MSLAESRRSGRRCSTLSDEDLRTLDKQLEQEIPAAQALHSAVKRERKRRRMQPQREPQ